MKKQRLILSILSVLSVLSLPLAAQTSGQWRFSKRNANGTYTDYGLTAVNGQAIGFTSGVPSMLSIAGGAWGSITGTLSSQTDLQTALDAKLATATAASTYAPLASPTFTGTINGASLSLSGGISVTGSIATGAGDFQTTVGNISTGSGTISGNGSGITAINASNISSGTLSIARIADASITNAKLASTYATADSDVAAYITLVTAAGGNLSTDVIAALNDLVTDGKVNGWWALGDEIGVFLGDTLAAQLVKLKTPGATSFTATNMTDADASLRGGFGPGSTNSNKYAVSDYTPSARSRSSTNFCMAVSTLGQIGSGSGNGNVLSSIGGASLFKLVIGAGMGGVYASTGSESIPAISRDGGLQTFSFSSNVVTRYLDDAQMSDKSISAVTLDQPISLFRSSFNSVFDYATGKIGFVFLGQSLTAAQAKAMGAAVRRFEIAIGRREARPVCAVFGDSITWGFGATTVQTGRWSTLVANALAHAEVNLGTQGSTLMGSAASSGIIRYADVTRCKPSKIIIMYGTNDAGSTYSATFRTNLDTILAAWIAAGVSAKNIVVCSMPWSTSGGRTFANQKLFAEAARGAAVAAGCVYADVFGRTLSNASTDIGGDTVHPSNAGHTNIANIILEAINGPAQSYLIGHARGVNIGAATNSDQAIHILASQYVVDSIVLSNPSADVSASACVASIRDAASGGGNALVSSVSFSGLTASGKFNSQTLASLAGTDRITAQPLYFRIAGTAHGSAVTVDVMIYGRRLTP